MVCFKWFSLLIVGSQSVTLRVITVWMTSESVRAHSKITFELLLADNNWYQRLGENKRFCLSLHNWRQALIRSKRQWKKSNAKGMRGMNAKWMHSTSRRIIYGNWWTTTTKRTERSYNVLLIAAPNWLTDEQWWTMSVLICIALLLLLLLGLQSPAQS